MNVRDRAPGYDQAAIRTLRERRHGALDLADVPHIDRAQLDAERRRRRLDYAELSRSSRDGGFSNDRHPRDSGRNLFEQLQPFRSDTVFEHNKTGGIAARPRQAFGVARADRVSDSREYDWNAAGRLQQWCESRAGNRQDDVGREGDQFRRVFANSAGIGTAPANIDADVAAI